MAVVSNAPILSSPVFLDDAPMSDRYSCDGANVSPPLAWTGVPAMEARARR